jgi:Raf kinase inhibitor-like YbhB/YbcL family protein
MTLRLWSEAFEEGGEIPPRFTADGDNVSPPLRWSNIPTRASELALVLEDLDAREDKGGPPLVHWIVWRIPARLDGLPGAMGAPRGGGAVGVAGEALEGINSFDHAGYDGPEPPDDQAHHYRFRLIALDTPLRFESPPTFAELEGAMGGHVVEETALVGVYGHRNR